ncbi:MAG: hypothetical protein S4CHLAM6_01310 [Chlamydiae bacterium]|nr:hypothetical protein [Chlamydiota bacterium]
MDRVVIIGSGLAAVAAAKALVENNIKPLVLDCGIKRPAHVASLISKLSSVHPNEWSEEDRKKMMANPTVFDNKSYPKKLSFGSDYFYSKIFGENFPPSSQAYGGFSVGWGSSSMPANDCDMTRWPIKQADLLEHYTSILKSVPYSACEDGLSENFPILSDRANPLCLSMASSSLINSMQKKSKQLKEKFAVFGQARLLIEAKSTLKTGCRYCGSCMSGCAYGSIYNATDDLDKLIQKGLVDYRANVTVQTLSEERGVVKVTFINEFGSQVSIDSSRVFLAAGAVNSTKIIAESRGIYDQDIPLLTTLGFVLPVVRMKRSKLEWPNINTEPGVFLEYKVPNLSNHWVHCQLTPVNELALVKLGIVRNGKLAKNSIKKRLFEHIVIANCNMHSDHGVEYNLRLKKENEGSASFEYSRSKVKRAQCSINLAAKRLSSLMRTFKCYPISKLMNSSVNSFGYHLGGSLPMRLVPTKKNETNILGSPMGWSKIHVIDSSVFPTLPGTTIGLLAMANARRIVKSVVSLSIKESKKEFALKNNSF